MAEGGLITHSLKRGCILAAAAVSKDSPSLAAPGPAGRGEQPAAGWACCSCPAGSSWILGGTKRGGKRVPGRHREDVMADRSRFSACYFLHILYVKPVKQQLRYLPALCRQRKYIIKCL